MLRVTVPECLANRMPKYKALRHLFTKTYHMSLNWESIFNVRPEIINIGTVSN